MTRQVALMHVAVRIVVRMVVLTAIAGAVAWAIIPARPVPLSIRWAADVGDQQRATLERRFALTGGELREGTTRSYLLNDASLANIEAIVRSPAVADTSDIDRGAFRPLPPFDRVRRIQTWTAIVALTGTALWELLLRLRRRLSCPVRVRGGALLAFAATAPLLLIAALSAMLVGALLGQRPFWRESATPNIAWAAYEEDAALLDRTVRERRDLNAPDRVLIDGRTVTVTPLEAAVVAGSIPTVQLLIANGARIDATRLRALQCLAESVHARDVIGYLHTLHGADGNPSCDDVDLPIQR